MIKPKLKVCAGFDGVEHEAYIYKNINGRKYCKSCTQKLEPSTYKFKIHAIRKISEKQKGKIEEKKELIKEDHKFYLDVWYQRFGKVEGTEDRNENGMCNVLLLPKCEVCGVRLWMEPNATYFHHVLEKRNYPQYRHEAWNIAIVCSECHNKYETMPDMVPYLKLKRDELLSKVAIGIL